MSLQRLEDYRSPAWTIREVAIEIELFDDCAMVKTRLQVQRLRAGEPLLLQGEGLQTLSVQVDEQAQDLPEPGATLLRLQPGAEQATVDIVVRINPWNNTALEGLYRSGPLVCTQCEPEGFRRITWFLDRPDVLARYTTTLRADAERFPVLLANGNCVRRQTLESGRHELVYVDPIPKPCYLFAMVAGDLAMIEDHWQTAQGRAVRLQIYAEAQDLPACTHAMQALKQAMAWDERHYGRCYDLDTYMIVAVSHFNMGAMENKGLNIFNTSCVLASPELSTDAGFDRVSSVIAHEYFHNWTGNRVTCRDWFQLCLKEGLTVYRDQQFSADLGSPAVQRIDDLVYLKTYQFSEDAGPLAHPVRPPTYHEINNFYTATVYEKGAEIIRMLHLLLGDSAYRAGMDLYFERHDGQAVTVEDLLRALGDANATDLLDFMPWYERAGTPVLRARLQRDADTHTLSLEQVLDTRPMPIRLAFLTASGEALPWHSQAPRRDDVLLLRQARVDVQVQCAQPVIPVILRGFSAPVLLDYPYSEAELVCIIEHESDGVSVWLAMQAYMTATLRRALASGRVQLSVSMTRLLQKILARAPQDPALAARLLTLPTLSALAEQVADYDPQALRRCHRQFEELVGRTLQRSWQEMLVHLNAAEPGWRALAVRALAYWSAGSAAAASADLLAAYEQATAMTPKLALLAALLQGGGVAAGQAVADFCRRYAAHPLVIDMAYAERVRAAPADPDAIAALLAEPGFDWAHPNRVRSVLMTWALQRMDILHQPDGRAYTMYLQALARIDRLNPQLAARLMGALAAVSSMSPVLRACARQHLARPELDRLSSEVQEMRANILTSLS